MLPVDWYRRRFGGLGGGKEKVSGPPSAGCAPVRTLGSAEGTAAVDRDVRSEFARGPSLLLPRDCSSLGIDDGPVALILFERSKSSLIGANVADGCKKAKRSPPASAVDDGV